jgi:iron complex outermembrane receptor protein
MIHHIFNNVELSVRKSGFLAFFLLIFLVNTSVQAQDTLDTPVMLTDTLAAMTVEATHHQLTVDEALGSISYLSADDLTSERGSATSFSDVVAELPGLIAQDRNNLALGERIMMRGMGWRSAFGIRGIQIVQNGIPLTLADGQTSSTIIEPAAIQRVQAIRGPASGYWGNGSNGVMYINTQPPASAPSIYWRYCRIL